MTEERSHPGEDLTLLVDGRLPAERRGKVEAHLAACAHCRRELDGLRLVKSGVHDALPERSVPPALAARVSAALDVESARGTTPPRRAMALRWATVVGLPLAAAAVLVLLLLWPKHERPDFVTAAAGDFIRFRAAQLALPIETGDAQLLERSFTTSGLPFTVRVYDLGMMGYRLSGGGVHRIAGPGRGRVSALYAYVGSRGDRVVCQMYEGTTAELPSGAEEREHDGIRFRIYRSGGVTLIFWQEGAIMCVLAADGDPEQAIQLAYAKAIKV
ncbi:MAG TPA: zf-HC2 domain-containing protein [Gemmatimonadales bacterium]|nr:zf-HC2 domain-containing protein [Gemmatimonadales bacterium]